MDTVARNHNLSGRQYPRPTFKCFECGGTLILCWGEERNPYLRHKSKSSKGCSATGESMVHRLAKMMLCEYLREGGNVLYNKKEVPLNLKWSDEVRHEKCIFDIAGSLNEEIIFGIEIWYKHKTANTEPRNDIPWIEVKAIQVIDLLDVRKVPGSITLDDHREYSESSESETGYTEDESSYEDTEEKTLCRGCNQMQSLFIIEMKGRCLNCDIDDYFNSLKGYRKCLKCDVNRISSKAPPSISVCYSCKDRYSSSELKDVLGKKGMRECFEYGEFNIFPKAPLYIKLCYSCQDKK